MKLSYLAKEVNGRANGEADISALCTDSRVAERGDLFLCFRGTHMDGHLYAEEAVRRGAVAVLCERELSLGVPCLLVEDGRAGMAYAAAAFYRHPEKSLSLVGVTGTNGKTTVVQMLHSVFTEAGERAGRIGTLGARYPGADIPPDLTTPDPVALFSLLADMKKAGVTRILMEVSAHALALKKELPICYDAAIFTNLSQDHLDFFGTMEEYGKAKKSLFTSSRTKLSVLNADDPFTQELQEGPFVTYGMTEPADCFAVVERESLKGSRVLLNLEDELCEAEIPLAGRHNVRNALAAAATARRLGAELKDIARGLSLTRVEGRLERVGEYHGAALFVDFAHTPDGLEKSLSALRPFCTGKLFLVFGCGGNRDRAKRPLMGKIAAEKADFTVITSDNPRYEEPCAILSEIEAGFREQSLHYVCIEEREKAIAYAVSRLEKGDVLLVAGKGGERTQEIMGIKYEYDDKAVLRAIMGG